MKRRGIVALLCVIGWMAACRWVPGVAQVGRRAALPIMGFIHRITAPVPFPVLEPLAFAVLLLGWRGRGRAMLAAFIIYGALWYPLYWAQTPPGFPEPDAAQLEALCRELIDALNGSSLASSAPVEGGAKSARYREWMSALGISGLYSPWTGEVILDPESPPEYSLFTSIHEAMHRSGIADEGMANIAAYRRCMALGGQWADSARLWALRYAAEALGRKDVTAEARLEARFSPALSRVFEPLGDGGQIGPNPIARWLGIGEFTTDYDALIGWLCDKMGQMSQNVVDMRHET